MNQIATSKLTSLYSLPLLKVLWSGLTRESNIIENHVFDAADANDVHSSSLLIPAQLNRAQAPSLAEQQRLSNKPLCDTTALLFADDYVEEWMRPRSDSRSWLKLL